MEERTLIYVNRITNLSDARYCAGMGVDLLGFVIDPASPDYVSPALFQELVGWISGPERVLEVGHTAINHDSIRDQYAADYLHIPEERLNEFTASAWKLIVEVSTNSESMASMHKSPVAFWAVHGIGKPIEDISVPYLTFGPVDSPIRESLNAVGAKGIILSGSRETAPGLKDYDNLSSVLEELNG